MSYFGLYDEVHEANVEAIRLQDENERLEAENKKLKHQITLLLDENLKEAYMKSSMSVNLTWQKFVLADDAEIEIWFETLKTTPLDKIKLKHLRRMPE